VQFVDVLSEPCKYSRAFRRDSELAPSAIRYSTRLGLVGQDWFARRNDIVQRLQQLFTEWDRDVDAEAKAFAATRQ
jgi:hypothetical protein